MSEWREVATLEGLNGFLDLVGGFHDGVLKEIHLVHRDSVGADLSMREGLLADARLLVQRQWETPSAVEIYCDRVWRLSFQSDGFIDGALARIETSSKAVGPPRPLLVLDLEIGEVACERLFWRDASDLMGAESRFGPFAPPPGVERSLDGGTGWGAAT